MHAINAPMTIDNAVTMDASAAALWAAFTACRALIAASLRPRTCWSRALSSPRHRHARHRIPSQRRANHRPQPRRQTHAALPAGKRLRRCAHNVVLLSSYGRRLRPSWAASGHQENARDLVTGWRKHFQLVVVGGSYPEHCVACHRLSIDEEPAHTRDLFLKPV
jgi:hypothetical protein